MQHSCNCFEWTRTQVSFTSRFYNIEFIVSMIFVTHQATPNNSGRCALYAQTFASAGTAGFMYWVVFYPTDVVKVSAIPVATYNHLLHLYAGGVVNSRLISSKNQIWCLIIEPCPKHFSRTTPLEDQGHLLHDFALLSKQEEFEFPWKRSGSTRLVLDSVWH